jgi:hypothetical protein
VCALLYADDMTQMSDLVGHLQKLIDCLSDYCYDWGMSVNFDKTKIIVFRNGGVIKQIEKWYFRGHQLEKSPSTNTLVYCSPADLCGSWLRKLLQLKQVKRLYLYFSLLQK